jgi:hypothetical protein
MSRKNQLRATLGFLALLGLLAYAWPKDSMDLAQAPQPEHAGVLQDRVGSGSDPLVPAQDHPTTRKSPEPVAPGTGTQRSTATTDLASEQQSGLVRVHDLDGALVEATSGYLILKFTGQGVASQAIPLRATIRGGAWSTVAPTTGTVEILKAVVGTGKRSYRATPFESSFPAADLSGRTFELALRIGPLLSVVDKDTGQHLQAVRVVLADATSQDYRDSYQSPPAVFAGGSATLSGDSPLQLAERSGTVAGWASAEGYAWRRFAFNADTVELIVRLERGSGLEVTIHGSDSLPFGAIIIYGTNSSGNTWLNAPLAVRRLGGLPAFSFSGLPPGRKSICVSQNPRTEAMGPYHAQAEVTLVAGEMHQLELDLAAGAATQGLGTLQVSMPLEFVTSVKQPRLCLEMLGGGESGVDSGRALESWLQNAADAGENPVVVEQGGLTPGQYVLTLLPLGVHRTLDITGGSITQVDLGGTPLRWVELLVLDPEGRGVSRAEMMIRPQDSASGVTWAGAPMTDSGGVSRVHLGVGHYTALPVGHPHTIEMVDFTVTESTGRIPIPLHDRKPATARVVVRRDGEDLLLPIPFWAAITVKPTGNFDGQFLSRKLLGNQIGGLKVSEYWAAELGVTTPGEYEITFREIPGVPVLPPQRVTLHAEGVTDLVVPWPE